MPKEDEVLTRVRAAGASHRFSLTDPVDERLRERGVSLADIRHALSAARLCISRGDGTFRIGGRDLDGSPLSLVVSIADGGTVLVVSEDDR